MQVQHTTDQNIEVIRLPKRILMADAKQTKKSLHNFLVCCMLYLHDFDTSDYL